MEIFNILEYKKVKVRENERGLIVGLESVIEDIYDLGLKFDEIPSLGKDDNFELSEKLEIIIDKIDKTTLNNCVKPICKRAVEDGLSREEFEEGFIYFCKNNDIKNPESLISEALEVFDFTLS